MSSAAEFHAIAALLGIETRHTDALSVIHEPDAETLAAMVAAFGLPPEPGKAAAVFADIRNAAPLGLDPLVVVAAEDPRLAFDLTRPAEWSVAFAQAGHAEGRWNPGEGEPRLPDDAPLGY